MNQWESAGLRLPSFPSSKPALLGVTTIPVHHTNRAQIERGTVPNILDYRDVTDLSAGALGSRRTDRRRVSVRAASNCAAIASNVGVGPFQRNWSTSSNKGRSVRSVASVRKSSARSRSRLRVSARALALAAFTCHSRQSSGIDSRWPYLPRTAADDFAPQAGRPGYPSAESPTSAK